MAKKVSHQHRSVRPKRALPTLGGSRLPAEEIERRIAERTADLEKVNQELRADLQRRRQSEEALRESEHRLRAATEASLDAFFVLESVRDVRKRVIDFSFLDLNQEGAELFASVAGELNDLRLFNLFPINCDSGLFERCVAVVETGRPLVEEFLLELSSGRSKWYRHQVVKLGDGIVITSRDITKDKEFAEVLKALPRRLFEAQEAERRRVARELHDGVSQLLASARFRLQSLANDQSDARRRATMAMAAGVLEQALREVRRISHDLRPSALDDLGLVPALRGIAAEFRARTGILVALRCRQWTARLAPEIEEALYRIVQEALTNVERHSRAKRVDLQLHRSAPAVRLLVRDDGAGFSPRRTRRPTGLGLVHMRERAEFVGGSFRLQAAPKRGTEIEVLIPVAAKT